jgi:hypothetical protein
VSGCYKKDADYLQVATKRTPIGAIIDLYGGIS